MISSPRSLLHRSGAVVAFYACFLSPAFAQDADLGPAVELPTLSVTANRTATPLSEVGSAVTIITGEELQQRQIRLVSDALRAVPGLAVNRTGGPGGLTQVRIRGSEGNQTLVIIDGVRMNDPSAGGEFDFSTLLTADIERIEVLRGPQSALYGSEAVGGVINIVTRRGEGAPSLSGYVEGGSFNTWQGNASVSGGGSQYSFLLGTAGLSTKGVSVVASDGERDGFKDGAIYGKASYDPLPNLGFDLVGRYQAAKRYGDEIEGLEAIGDSVGHSRQFFGRAQARLSLLDGLWQNIVGLSYTDHDRDNEGEVYGKSSYRGKTWRYDYQADLTFATPTLADAQHVVTLAADYQRDQVVSTSATAGFDKDIGATGLVGQYQLTVFQDLTLTGAIRQDWNEEFRSATTYRGTLAYRVDWTDTKLRASYGTGVKNPTLFELYGYSGNWQGNPDLKPERGKGWDAGFDQPLFDGKVLFSFTYFDQRITDLIQGAGNTAINLDGVSRSNGVELGLTLTPIENLSIQASYSYMKTRDANGDELVRRPANLASLYVDYRFLQQKANVNLGLVYNGKQADWYFPPWPAAREDVTLGAYTLLTIGGSYRLFDQVELYARVENALDQSYEEVYGYGTAGVAAYGGLRFAF